MRRNGIREFWANRPDVTLTAEKLLQIKTAFGVAGELRAPEFAPGYAVSDDGRVFSNIPCSWMKECPRELRRAPSGTGRYELVHLHINKKQRPLTVHSLVGRCFLPPPKAGQTCIRHLDGNPANNKIANLAWGRYSENGADMVRHGRSRKGTAMHMAKLNDWQVRIGRRLWNEGWTYAAIARLFGVSGGTLKRAVTGECWGHIPGAIRQ